MAEGFAGGGGTVAGAGMEGMAFAEGKDGDGGVSGVVVAALGVRDTRLRPVDSVGVPGGVRGGMAGMVCGGGAERRASAAISPARLRRGDASNGDVDGGGEGAPGGVAQAIAVACRLAIG